MYIVYILLSEKLGKYYVGLTGDDLQDRIQKRNNQQYGTHRFTAAASDWKLHFMVS